MPQWTPGSTHTRLAAYRAQGTQDRRLPQHSSRTPHGLNTPAPASPGTQRGSQLRLCKPVRAANMGTLTTHGTGPRLPRAAAGTGSLATRYTVCSAQSTCWRPSAGPLGCKEATVPACVCPHVGLTGLLGWPVRPTASCQMPRLRKTEGWAQCWALVMTDERRHPTPPPTLQTGTPGPRELTKPLIQVTSCPSQDLAPGIKWVISGFFRGKKRKANVFLFVFATLHVLKHLSSPDQGSNPCPRQ